MIVLDTHAWLWWVTAPERLSKGARGAIDAADGLGVATISCWEVGMLVTAGRIRLDRDVSVWVRQALAMPKILAITLTPEIAVAAAVLAAEGLRGDPADRIIAATSREHDAALVTKDRTLRAARLRTVW